ncbi:MAG: hypothetical protein KGK11_14685 [Sphingomonadales bacterium]|nr:hypothetical protein [Sphingomonadales bacterium]
MTTIKSFGSLSSGLLARKGFARPAMRSPLHQYPLENEMPGETQLDDLGWNDMGEPEPVSAPAEVVPISPAVDAALAVPREAVKPEILRQQEAMARLIRIPQRRPRGTALTEGRRAAFTLRVDAERHFLLRRACAAMQCSAQVLLLEAFDRMLADMPELAHFPESDEFPG